MYFSDEMQIAIINEKKDVLKKLATISNRAKSSHNVLNEVLEYLFINAMDSYLINDDVLSFQMRKEALSMPGDFFSLICLQNYKSTEGNIII